MTFAMRWWTLSALDGTHRDAGQAVARLDGTGPASIPPLQGRYGQANEHNGLVPRDHWLEDWEKLSITEFAKKNRWKAIGGWRSCCWTPTWWPSAPAASIGF